MFSLGGMRSGGLARAGPAIGCGTAAGALALWAWRREAATAGKTASPGREERGSRPRAARPSFHRASFCETFCGELRAGRKTAEGLCEALRREFARPGCEVHAPPRMQIRPAKNAVPLPCSAHLPEGGDDHFGRGKKSRVVAVTHALTVPVQLGGRISVATILIDDADVDAPLEFGEKLQRQLSGADFGDASSTVDLLNPFAASLRRVAPAAAPTELAADAQSVFRYFLDRHAPRWCADFVRSKISFEEFLDEYHQKEIGTRRLLIDPERDEDCSQQQQTADNYPQLSVGAERLAGGAMGFGAATKQRDREIAAVNNDPQTSAGGDHAPFRESSLTDAERLLCYTFARVWKEELEGPDAMTEKLRARLRVSAGFARKLVLRVMNES